MEVSSFQDDFVWFGSIQGGKFQGNNKAILALYHI